jgi:hypothetical protein
MSPKLLVSDQMILFAMHMVAAGLLFYTFQWWYSRPLASRGETGRQPKRGARVSLVATAMTLRALNLALSLIFDYEYRPWVPCFFQQLLFR